MKVFVILPKYLRGCWNYVSDEEVKCGNCNWSATKLYAIARSKREAIKLVREGYAGICGECLAEMIADKGCELKLPEKR